MPGASVWLAIVAVSAVVGAAAGAAVYAGLGATGSSNAPGSVYASDATPGPALAQGASVPRIVSRLLPEVVSIDATGTVPGVSGGGPFGLGIPTPQAFKSEGSGMIMSSGGLVLTNNHVVAGASSVAVTLHGSTKALPARVLGTDPAQDMALLRIDHPPAGLAAVTFGNSSSLVPGDAVIAIGNALGLSASSPTVTSGIVSALGRTVSASVPTTGTTETLTNMIQTDAPINPGNSGGPLVDSSGDVVGMNTATAGGTSDGTQAEGIGFAIPSNSLRLAIPRLERGGTSGAPGAYLGVEVEDNSPLLAQQYGFATSSGAVIVAVQAGSPAQSAGLSPGDIIVNFDHVDVSGAQALTEVEAGLKPGERVPVVVYEGSAKVTINVDLAIRPAP
jgi:S1-C subfamily serine protease